MIITRNRRKVDVNVVPLVDVMTSLIFFFLLTMQFKDVYSVDITPPKMESASEEATHRPNTIAVDKTGKYYYNTKEITVDSLKRKLDELSVSAPDIVLILYADKDVPLHHVTKAIDLVRLSKVKKLSLQTDK